MERAAAIRIVWGEKGAERATAPPKPETGDEMLQINPDKVCYVIANVREFDAQEEADPEEEGSSAIDEGFRGVLAASDEDATYDELKEYINDLNDDEQADLVALAWLGRGDYTADDWNQAVQDAAERHTGPTADYLLGIPVLADYLEAGLNELGYSCDSLAV